MEMVSLKAELQSTGELLRMENGDPKGPFPSPPDVLLWILLAENHSLHGAISFTLKGQGLWGDFRFVFCFVFDRE